VRIDLHAHSTASDGTFTPAELVTAAADKTKELADKAKDAVKK